MIERMFEEPTAFRHRTCGGRIMQRRRRGRLIFECDACRAWSEDALDLVKDPRLPTPAEDGQAETAVRPGDSNNPSRSAG